MRRLDLRGCGTALVTPFQADGEVDLEAFRTLVRWQIDSGIDFLVPCGTTGESVSLTEAEYEALIGACVEVSAGAVPVVAGAGSNNTRHAETLAGLARQAGADAVLSVTPYYNKPTPEGLLQHFGKVAAAARIPLLVYNVPGRTGSNMTPETICRLAGLEGIVGVKEASGNLPQIMEIMARRPDGFCVFSGDDSLALPVLAAGGEGLISVASNLIPGEMSRMVARLLEGHLEEARQIHYRYLHLMHLNFVESNPIPVKYALFRMGRIREVYRLPLCPLSRDNKEKMDAELQKLELLKTT